MQQLDISQVQADELGKVVSEESGLRVEKPKSDEDTLTGSFDASQGVLTLNIPEQGKIQISGFPSALDLGHGPAGAEGAAGRDGVDGLMGNDGGRGPDGCPGPRGTPGAPGKQGPRGQIGPPGPTGPTGATGERGEDGRVQIFIQSEDPAIENAGTIAPGALWVRP